MRCGYCGRKIRDAAKFCPYCGKRNDRSSEFADKFDSRDGLLVVKAQEIFRERKSEKHKRKLKLPPSAVPITFCALLLVGGGTWAASEFLLPELRYINAEKLYKKKAFAEAEEEFSELDSYKNSSVYVLKCRYENALQLMEQGSYPEAADAFTSLDGYADSDALAARCMVRMADGYAEKGSLEQAALIYAAAGNPDLIEPAARKKAASLAENGDFFTAADIAEKYWGGEEALEYRYQGAKNAREKGFFKTAADNFLILGEYKDAAVLAKECAYGYYMSEYQKNGASEETARGFYFLGDYMDSRTKFIECSYEYGNICLESGDCFTAAAMFRNTGSYKDSSALLYEARYALGLSLLDSDPASARSVFALLSTYNDSAEMKKNAAEMLSAEESWYADCYTSADGYCTSVFEKNDVLMVSCSAGTETISPPVTLTVTLTDSNGASLSADCENLRNSGSFSVSFSLSDMAAGDAFITISRKDNGSMLRTADITIK